MHPALSVIFFTTASGAGYGLLALLGIGTTFGWLPGEATLVTAAGITALVLVTAGLLSSTFHLGHPERAWRAMSQWRSSWLSREGVMALLTFVPAVAFIGASLLHGKHGSFIATAGGINAVFALVTVFTTAMIYASLRSIDAWHNAWVPAVYLCLAVASGMVLLNAFIAWFEGPSAAAGVLAIALLGIGLIVKSAYWRRIDAAPATSSVTSAVGVDRNSRVSLSQAPHSHENYLQQEMGFQIARKHARKLRRLALLGTFVVPILLSACLLGDHGGLARGASLLAVVSLALGLLTERWLFFAEAKHTVSLYY